MSKLSVSEDKKTFQLDGRYFFYLADTVWSAFTNASFEEWDFYLEKRWAQGFNVLQINTLPQWDRCIDDFAIYPFETKDEMKFDFTKWNPGFYTKARQMCQMAVEKGFQLALVVLWLNYVPGTWGSRMSDINIMPKEFVKKYTQRVLDEFEEFDPIYVISGDTDFDTPQAIEYYEIALDTICEKSPDSLKTMHIKRGYDYIPSQFLDRIDFYMFQSGHNAKEQHMAYYLPESFLAKYPQKPLINAEPCYEQMGFSRQEYGRFQAFDIRKAAWSSLLSGACAGVTYGAHGVWNWKKENKRKNLMLGEGFDVSFPVQEALLFPGAWDYGYVKQLLTLHHLAPLTSMQHMLSDESKDIRIAATSNQQYVIYMPYTTSIQLNVNLEKYSGIVIDLTQQKIANIKLEKNADGTKIHMHPFKNDVLILLLLQN